ncbi:MAG: TetR/AcrR family transcriptional regulator [Deltaproteobacteria bacterium]|nr:MAG: TetR/AcrR family transcriptional regulator [Deltaproteobacteria bacterium]
MTIDRRSTKREARRRQLLDAAMAIVVDEGLDALTVAGIAKRLDAAVGSLYRYFPGKDALVVGLQERAIHDFEAFLEARLAVTRHQLGAELDTPTGRLTLLLVAFSSYLDDRVADPSRHRLLDAFLSTSRHVLSDAHARAVDQVLAPLLGSIVHLLDDAVEAGDLGLGDNRVRTHVGWAAALGLDHLRKRDRILAEELRVPRLFDETWSALLQGWGAPKEAVAAALARRATLDLDVSDEVAAG